MAGMLPHLGRACREARVNAGLRQIDIATTAQTTHASISRFEAGEYWPVDPDKWIDAYETETGIAGVELWARALELLRAGA